MRTIRSQGSEPMPEIPVNGEVLKWARKIRGLDLRTAADLLEVFPAELLKYESGENKPLVGFLRKMSHKYRVNFTSLLMPEPLPVPNRPTDHRIRGVDSPPLSIDTLVAIEEIMEALETFEDIASETQQIIPKLDIGSAELSEDPEDVAKRERRRFGVSVDEQRRWPGLATARREWRRRIEVRGVFTYMIPMPPEELSGFSLLHDGLVAAICVNDREPTEGAKVFTLFHEYCHLLLRQTGISDENNTNRVEIFCNSFAASFLIPRTSIRDAIGCVDIPHEFSDGDVKQLAARFRVSNSAMALRLEKAEFAPRGFWARRTAPWDVPSTPRKPRKEGQPSSVMIRMKRIGKLHASTVLEAVKVHAINEFDASELIGLQPKTFPKVREAIG